MLAVDANQGARVERKVPSVVLRGKNVRREYTYFFIKTIAPQTEIKAAKYLTMAQITQFFTGIFC